MPLHSLTGKPVTSTHSPGTERHYLFDSQGMHIATWLSDRLYAPSGRHIGHYMASLHIFVDRQGYYLGEVRYTDRLLHRIHHAYRHVCFGSLGDYGSIASAAAPGNRRTLGQVPGFQDVTKSRLHGG